MLVEAGVCTASERWVVNKALYGLPSSPACWAVHRDNTLRNFSWQDFTLGMKCRMRQTPEGNLWEVVGTSEKGESVVGHVLVYVDDMMVLGSDSVRNGFMKRMTEEWKCTPGESVNTDGWVRFSGFELRLVPAIWGFRLLLGLQPFGMIYHVRSCSVNWKYYVTCLGLMSALAKILMFHDRSNNMSWADVSAG